ncbi:hypothetical protein LOK49_LG07G00614 [Camellia lanceoleosa]|uniref:Uncharacterized protein n=1 Tax=Camellia lanceoleosa TaxID=1840588 RepID=A0ACC0GYJ4_9ERIC|nr:hypothetical protein LOK49_LG07G00614 [Camellia lanceoleosa]
MENEVSGSMGQVEFDQLSRNGDPENEEHEDEHTRKEELCKKEKNAVAEQDMVDCEAGEKDEGNECLSISAVKETVEDMGNQKVRGENMKDQNGAIFRAAAAAISLSVEHSLNTRRRNKLLNEAQATMEVGKILGLDFEGKENEMIGKLIELEQKDMERVEGEAVIPALFCCLSAVKCMEISLFADWLSSGLPLGWFASNIIFSNGLRDSYSSGGVLEDISDSVLAVSTVNVQFCAGQLVLRNVGEDLNNNGEVYIQHSTRNNPIPPYRLFQFCVDKPGMLVCSMFMSAGLSVYWFINVGLLCLVLLLIRIGLNSFLAVFSSAANLVSQLW